MISRQSKELTPKDFFTHSGLNCDICYQTYNHTSRIPLITCSNKHIVCSDCIRPVRKNKKCPFCREPFPGDQLLIDYKTYDKIPKQEGPVPNLRKQQRVQYYELTPEPSERDSQDDQPAFYLEMQENWQFQRRQLVEETRRKRIIIYLCTLFFVVPVFLLDGYFGFFFFSQPKCTDATFLFGAVNLRTWLVVISFTQGMYLIILMASFVKRKMGNIYQEFYLNSLEEIYSMGVAFKALICSVVELAYFFGLVMSVCTGPIYVYELTLACFHIVKLVIVVIVICRAICRR